MGPSAILTFITLALSSKRLLFADLIFPVAIISMSIMLIIINMSDDIIEEKNSRFRQYNFLIIYASYTIGCLFITASWLIGFMLRVPAIIVTLSILLVFRVNAGDDIVIGQSIILSAAALAM